MAQKSSAQPDPLSRRTGLVVLLILAAVLVVLTGVLIRQFVLADQAALAPKQTQQVIGLGGFEVDPAEAVRYYPFAGQAVYISPSRLAILDEKGEEHFSHAVNFISAQTFANAQRFLVTDRESGRYLLLDASGVRLEGTINGRVAGAALSGNEWFALIEETSDSHGNVQLFRQSDGAKLFTMQFPESGYPVFVTFTPDQKYLDIALINTNGTAIQSLIKRYDLEGQPQGQFLPLSIQGIYTQILYDRQSRPVLTGSTGLTAFDPESGGPVWQTAFGQILAAGSDPDGNISLMTSERAGGPVQLVELDDQGQVAKSTPIDAQPTRPAIQRNLVAYGVGTHVQIYNLKQDKIISDQPVEAEVLRLAYTGQDQLTVVTRKGVYRLSTKG